MRIAFIHQGYELYGSDRCFLESVAAVRSTYPEATIEVVLPRAGPIVPMLAGLADRVTFEPIWVLRRQSLARLMTRGLAALPSALLRAARRFSASDLVYVNTSVVADYGLVARFFPGKALLHIHEIAEGPTRHILRLLARWGRAEVIFNSQATRTAFGLNRTAACHVVYNGIAGPPCPEPCTYDGTRPLRVLMLGRINRIKGQEVLLEALATLPVEVRSRISVRMVGSAFESDAREVALRDLVRTTGLTSEVSVEPFLHDPAPLYRWADIVVVPSRRPESLGRVAIEAMAFGRPPLASAIGGLVEVVEDGRSGWLVPPGDSSALAARLRAIVEAPEQWRGFSTAARDRYEALFSEKVAAAAIAAIVGGMLERLQSRRAAANASDTVVMVR